jgi:hypothetical protein
MVSSVAGYMKKLNLDLSSLRFEWSHTGTTHPTLGFRPIGSEFKWVMGEL